MGIREKMLDVLPAASYQIVEADDGVAFSQKAVTKV
jgi:hypothetical protein